MTLQSRMIRSERSEPGWRSVNVIFKRIVVEKLLPPQEGAIDLGQSGIVANLRARDKDHLGLNINDLSRVRVAQQEGGRGQASILEQAAPIRSDHRHRLVHLATVASLRTDIIGGVGASALPAHSAA